jgi:ferredoxin
VNAAATASAGAAVFAAPRPPADAEPPARGERLLRPLDRALSTLDRATAAALPAQLNPFLQLGALANWSFLIAVATGIALLFFYTPSVHQAHASMLAMDAAPWTSGLVRSLHRYSSDACMALVLLHALKVFAARRFSGPRWFAWLTGAFSLLCLWLVGWLGYWLPWDQPAQHIAEGTARALDVVPLFVDSLERSFVTDAGVNSLLFFLVFFAHMLLPLLMGIGLWLHITRLARARFLPAKPMLWWSAAVLVLLSAAVPARTGAPAAMAVKAAALEIDAWYLAPLWLTDRLAGVALWLFWLTSGALLCSVPWLLPRRRVRTAAVEVARCNACTKCSVDCPYLAITMVPRTDGKPYAQQAQIDPKLCVGCGICSGSCDTAGIGLPWLPQRGERERIEAMLAPAVARGEPPGLLLACAHGAARSLRADAATGECSLPGWLALEVPCAGWVHMGTAERALKLGAREVAIASCGDGNCRYREGDEWARQRLAGRREPFLRRDRVDADRVRFVSLPPGADVAAILTPGAVPARPTGVRRALGFVAVAAAVALVAAGSFVGYRPPLDDQPELVVSFKHPGQLTEQRRPLTDAEKAALPPHMRREFDLVRTRQPVRLRIAVDGVELVARSYAPTGIWGDGNSIALERLPVAPGPHRVDVAIGDGGDDAVFEHTISAEVEFERSRRRALLFDRHQGFTWH